MSPAAEPETPGTAIIFQPVRLPCGREVRNRLVKVAMYEHLATFTGGPPNELHHRLYSEWSQHSWGMVITGNVQIAADHLSLGRDIVLPNDLRNPGPEYLQSFTKLAQTIRAPSIDGLRASGSANGQNKAGNETLAILQLNHTGRQSSNFLGGRWPLCAPFAPSAIRVGTPLGHNHGLIERFVNAALFQTPTAMSPGNVRSMIDRFVECAVFAQRAGFDGVQFHVAHGYLLAQFLSPQTNERKDAYSCEKALDLLHTIVASTRSSTSKDFVIGIKLNAADYTSSTAAGGSSSTFLTKNEQRSMKHLSDIAGWGLVDFVEISGGDYEKPVFMASEAPSTTAFDAPPDTSREEILDPRSPKSKSRRQAFFAHFSQKAVEHLSAANASKRPLILLTGGLNSPSLLTTALASRHADLLGLGRASVLCPNIPSVLQGLLTSSNVSEEAPFDPDEPFCAAPTLSNPPLLSYPPISWLWSLLSSVKLVGAGTTMAWYTLHMRRIALQPFLDQTEKRTRPMKPDYDMGGIVSVLKMFLWVLPSRANGRVISPPWLLLLLTCVAVLASYSLAPAYASLMNEGRG